MAVSCFKHCSNFSVIRLKQRAVSSGLTCSACKFRRAFHILPCTSLCTKCPPHRLQGIHEAYNLDLLTREARPSCLFFSNCKVSAKHEGMFQSSHGGLTLRRPHLSARRWTHQGCRCHPFCCMLMPGTILLNKYLPFSAVIKHGSATDPFFKDGRKIGWWRSILSSPGHEYINEVCHGRLLIHWGEREMKEREGEWHLLEKDNEAVVQFSSQATYQLIVLNWRSNNI